MNPDTQSLTAVVRALYETISGAAGEPRNWDRERELLHPTARLMRTGVNEDGRPWIQVMTVDDYIESTGELFERTAIHEVEIGREIRRFGNIAHVFSAYELQSDDPTMRRRGINSIQCYHDGERWWVMSVLWDNEREGVELPEELAP